jgi:3-hydroxyisobutyrate dehydrogenase
MLKAVFPHVIERNFEPAGYARQILKDLGMLHNLAKSMSVPTPMCRQTSYLFCILNSMGNGASGRQGIGLSARHPNARNGGA